MDQKILADLIGYLAAIIGALMFLPQAIQLWKTKNTKDISLASFALILLASLLWIIYGLLLMAPPILFVNTVIGVLCLFIIYLKLRYK